MNASRQSVRITTTILGASLFFGISLGEVPPLAKEAPVSESKSPAHGSCDDSLVALATVDPEMDNNFFRTTETSYHPMIVEDENGHLEDLRCTNTALRKINPQPGIRSLLPVSR
ncbi:MAG: hypothetical protein ACKV19_18525 [Verrucomicrobiales bacterium]